MLATDSLGNNINVCFLSLEVCFQTLLFLDLSVRFVKRSLISAINLVNTMLLLLIDVMTKTIEKKTQVVINRNYPLNV